MGSTVVVLLEEVERARKDLNAAKGTQLHSAKARAALRSLAERYFSEVRPALEATGGPTEHRSAVDKAMKDLLALCHKRATIEKYKTLLRTAKGHLIHLDSGLIAIASESGTQIRNGQDTRIMTTLRALKPSAAASYEQALADLSLPSRLSWRGPATDLREALRETLDHLAPDEEVIRSPGYRSEPSTNGPTMKQKVRFILKHRGQSNAALATTEDATVAIEEAIGSFVRSVYTRSSVSTHTPTDRREVLRVLDLVRVVLGELLEAG